MEMKPFTFEAQPRRSEALAELNRFSTHFDGACGSQRSWFCLLRDSEAVGPSLSEDFVGLVWPEQLSELGVLFLSSCCAALLLNAKTTFTRACKGSKQAKKIQSTVLFDRELAAVSFNACKSFNL